MERIQRPGAVTITCFESTVTQELPNSYLGHGECRGAHLPIGRGESWDATKTLQFSVAMRGAGRKLLELVILRQSCWQWAEA